jgi:hypothetical protein
MVTIADFPAKSFPPRASEAHSGKASYKFTSVNRHKAGDAYVGEVKRTHGKASENRTTGHNESEDSPWMTVL